MHREVKSAKRKCFTTKDLKESDSPTDVVLDDESDDDF